jgi:uncharacterized damage-inducible protein DinB
MADSDALRALLTTQLDATVARRPPGEILRAVPPEARGIQPDGLPEAYSLWQILEHMRICQADYLDYCMDPDYTLPTWPDDYWPESVAPPSDAAWKESLEGFQADLQAAKELVNDPDVDLDGPIPHADGVAYHGLTYAAEIAAIADHNAYHLGQFVTVRRLLGVWPPADVGNPDWEDAL